MEKLSSRQAEKDSDKQKVLTFQEDGQKCKNAKSNLPLSQTVNIFRFLKGLKKLKLARLQNWQNKESKTDKIY